MTLFKKNTFNPFQSSRKLNKDYDFVFDRGWSPVLTVDDTSVAGSKYLKLYDWIGGEGDKPFDPSISDYWIGDTGYVTTVGDAIDLAILVGDVQNFLQLLDTPSGYSGSATKLVVVNATEDGLEFKTVDYYTKIELDTGQLDDRYYTETELDAGQLDTRYYTESETDTLLLGKSDTSHTHDDRYYTETELNNGQLDTRYYTETEIDGMLGGFEVISNKTTTMDYDTPSNTEYPTEKAIVDYISSGLYTPSVNLEENIAGGTLGTVTDIDYIIVGNRIHVSGKVSVTFSGTGFCSIVFSTPFGTIYKAIGTITNNNNSIISSAIITYGLGDFRIGAIVSSAGTNTFHFNAVLTNVFLS